MTAWIENDELARKLTEQGWWWQRFVGAFFQAHGLEVDLPEYSWRESIADIPEHEDSVDLTISGERIEVKSRNLYFTCDPRTFPYDRAFVDTVRKYELHDPKPLAYVFVSQKTGSMLCVPGRNEDEVSRWDIVEKFDHVRKINERFYTVDRSRMTGPAVLVNRLLRTPST